MCSFAIDLIFADLPKSHKNLKPGRSVKKYLFLFQHKHGWRFQKRPGVDMFLSQVGYPNFELVIFTTENGMTFDPIVNGLDPELQHIMYRLYRDATRYVNGHHTKDLSAINRDLKKVRRESNLKKN